VLLADGHRLERDEENCAMDDTELLIEEVQQLVWALVDDVATEEQVRRLEALVLQHAAARKTYVDCMALHAELHCMFAPPKPVKPIAVPLPVPSMTGESPVASGPNDKTRVSGVACHDVHSSGKPSSPTGTDGFFFVFPGAGF
jgi:hypothetical protein